MNGDRQMLPVHTVRMRAGEVMRWGSADTLQLGGDVALQRLVDGRHVHDHIMSSAGRTCAPPPCSHWRAGCG